MCRLNKTQMTANAGKEFTGTLRKALPGDVDRLIELGRRCFYEAFSEVTAPHDMAAYLETTFRKSAIENQLGDARSLIYIAEMGSDPAGYVYSHPAKPPECVAGQTAIKLVRLYLRRRYYGCGVGDALMQTSLAESRARGYQTVWLSSWELNDRANAFYKKWQFKVVGSQKFSVGSDIQDDFILSRSL
jgi:ribosomal protein S18 acetylase RimI-like enzyme